MHFLADAEVSASNKFTQFTKQIDAMTEEKLINGVQVAGAHPSGVVRVRGRDRRLPAL